MGRHHSERTVRCHQSRGTGKGARSLPQHGQGAGETPTAQDHR